MQKKSTDSSEATSSMLSGLGLVLPIIWLTYGRFRANKQSLLCRIIFFYSHVMRNLVSEQITYHYFVEFGRLYSHILCKIYAHVIRKITRYQPWSAAREAFRWGRVHMSGQKCCWSARSFSLTLCSGQGNDSFFLLCKTVNSSKYWTKISWCFLDYYTTF